MDRIEAVEKAEAILRDNFDCVREEVAYYSDGSELHKFWAYSKDEMPNEQCAAMGDSWESLIEDLEESMRIPA